MMTARNPAAERISLCPAKKKPSTRDIGHLQTASVQSSDKIPQLQCQRSQRKRSGEAMLTGSLQSKLSNDR